MKKILVVFTCLCLSMKNANSVTIDDLLSMGNKDDYSIEDHVQQTFDLGCSGFDKLSVIVGECTWLKCKLIACSIKISLMVEHRSPDLLVEVKNSDKDSVIPSIKFMEDTIESMGVFLHSAFGLAFGSIKSGPKLNKSELKKGATQNLSSFDVTVIGNPYLLLYETAMSSLMDSMEIGSFCSSQVTPFMPYYTSKTDPEWRFGLGERINSIIDTASFNTRNIDNFGLFFNPTDPIGSLNAAAGINWGYIYPRMGVQKSKSAYRSAALMAQRVGSIMSEGDDNGINLHIPTAGEFPPNEVGTDAKTIKVYDVIEHDDKHTWQLNYPQGKRGSGCYRFPDTEWDGADFINGNFQSVLSPEGIMKLADTNIQPKDYDMPSDSNAYVFTLWRTFRCCTKKGGFLFDIQWD